MKKHLKTEKHKKLMKNKEKYKKKNSASYDKPVQNTEKDFLIEFQMVMMIMIILCSQIDVNNWFQVKFENHNIKLNLWLKNPM